MRKKEMLIKALHSIACLNHIIESLESLGLVVEDKAFDGVLYKAYDGPCDIAIDCLTFKDTIEENRVYNRFLQVTLDNYEDFANDVWEEYGDSKENN